MPSTFWSNTIWYVLLGCTSIISIVLIIWKSKNRKFDIAFLCAITGLTYQLEYVLLPILNAYRYHPKFFEDTFYDSIMGNSFSQISISTSLMLIIILNLSPRWYFIVGAGYYLIEKFFIQVGAFQVLWYKSWITFIVFIIGCFLVKKWYHKMLYSPKYYIYYVTLFLAVFTFFGNATLYFFYSEAQIFDLKIYSEFPRNNCFFMAIYWWITIYANISIYKWGANWKWKGLTFTFIFLALYFTEKVGIVHYRYGWFLIVTTINYGSCYLGVVIMDYLLSRGGKSIKLINYKNT